MTGVQTCALPICELFQVTSTGPDHHKEFTAVVVVADTEYGSGVGRSKKEAEQHAAAAAWKTLSVLDSA